MLHVTRSYKDDYNTLYLHQTHAFISNTHTQSTSCVHTILKDALCPNKPSYMCENVKKGNSRVGEEMEKKKENCAREKKYVEC